METSRRSTEKVSVRRSRQLRYEVQQRERRKKLRKRGLLGIGAAVCAVYAAVGIYYSAHFYRGTVLYGGDCSNLTASRAKEVVAGKLKNFRLRIEERENGREELSAGQMGIAFRDDGGVERLLRSQRPYLWPVMMALPKEDSLKAAFTYDPELVNTSLDGLNCMDAARAVAPRDAYIDVNARDTAFEVVPEVQGTTLDREKTRQAVYAALDEGKTSLSLEEAGCYQSPAVLGDDAALNAEADAKNQFTGANITWDFGDRQEYVGTLMIGEWLTENGDGSYSLDEEKVRQYVTELAGQYDTFGLGREFVTYYGDTVSLFGGDYGWLMDQEATVQKLLDALADKYVGVLEPDYTYSAMSRGTDDIGGTYVEVCISQQRMWCYQDGYVAVDTPVVTGNPNTGHGTPSGGVWAIDSKMRNYTLRGEDYAAPVDYWMAFNGDVGIHDLVSRSTFGGDIYLYGGSHGCVNTPYDAVSQIYDIVSIGTPVVVYE